MNLSQTIGLFGGGPGSGCHGENCGRPRTESGTRSTPIRVKTIEEAIPLILEGKVVELPDTKSVNTLLEKLATMHTEGVNYDLCNVTVKGTNLFCGEHVGMQRINMPQFSGHSRPGSPADDLPKDAKGGVNAGEEFIAHLKSLGISTKEESVPAAYLRASQRELVGTKVAQMMAKKGRKLLEGKPIFVSRDNYVIDGHHRWAAVVGLDAGTKKFGNLRMDVHRVDAPISDVLHIAKKWSKMFGLESKGID